MLDTENVRTRLSTSFALSLAADAFGTMATMATLFAGGRIFTRRSSMGARATFRGFNDAKRAQLEVRVDAHTSTALISIRRCGPFPREPACTREARERVRGILPAVRGVASTRHIRLTSSHPRAMTSPTHTTARASRSRPRRLAQAPVRDRGGEGARDVHRRDPHAVLARGDRLKETEG